MQKDFKTEQDAFVKHECPRITHRKLKPFILMIWTFFHRIIFVKNRLGFFFRMKSTSHAVTVRFIEFCYKSTFLFTVQKRFLIWRGSCRL
jgi:hypothetical protein